MAMGTTLATSSVATLSDGNYVTVTLESTSSHIMAYIRQPTGPLATATPVLLKTISFGFDSPSVAALADGKFVVIWNEGGIDFGNSIKGQVFDAMGVSVGSEFVVAHGANVAVSAPTVTALSGESLL